MVGFGGPPPLLQQQNNRGAGDVERQQKELERQQKRQRALLPPSERLRAEVEEKLAERDGLIVAAGEYDIDFLAPAKEDHDRAMREFRAAEARVADAGDAYLEFMEQARREEGGLCGKNAEMAAELDSCRPEAKQTNEKTRKLLKELEEIGGKLREKRREADAACGLTKEKLEQLATVGGADFELQRVKETAEAGRKFAISELMDLGRERENLRDLRQKVHEIKNHVQLVYVADSANSADCVEGNSTGLPELRNPEQHSSAKMNLSSGATPRPLSSEPPGSTSTPRYFCGAGKGPPADDHSQNLLQQLEAQHARGQDAYAFLKENPHLAGGLLPGQVRVDEALYLDEIHRNHFADALEEIPWLDAVEENGGTTSTYVRGADEGAPQALRAQRGLSCEAPSKQQRAEAISLVCKNFFMKEVKYIRARMEKQKQSGCIVFVGQSKDLFRAVAEGIGAAFNKGLGRGAGEIGMNEKHAAVPAAVSTSSRTISARRKRTSRALAAATGEEAEDGEDGFRIAAVQYRVRKITPNHVCVLGAKKLGADIGNAEGSSCSWGIPGGSASVEDDLPEEQGVTSMLLRPAKAAKTEGGGSFAPGVVEGSGSSCFPGQDFLATGHCAGQCAHLTQQEKKRYLLQCLPEPELQPSLSLVYLPLKPKSQQQVEDLKTISEIFERLGGMGGAAAGQQQHGKTTPTNSSSSAAGAHHSAGGMAGLEPGVVSKPGGGGGPVVSRQVDGTPTPGAGLSASSTFSPAVIPGGILPAPQTQTTFFKAGGFERNFVYADDAQIFKEVAEAGIDKVTGNAYSGYVSVVLENVSAGILASSLKWRSYDSRGGVALSEHDRRNL